MRENGGYRKMKKEDAEDVMHRKAQFLIHKVLERADSRGRPSYLRIRIRRLKVRFGRRLKKLNNTAFSTISAVKIGVCKRLIHGLKTCKFFFARHQQTTFSSLPPLIR